ncbi:hypothetical protein LIER_17888 [Lithospermum erythrorhizon]|uniref:Uncharacterized protein n=1 Tax=Lithospermum erythrorhizon TaxID=34254 RepID=A0AAV3QGF5_LITER
MPISASLKECKTKMPFTDRLDAISLPKGFVLPSLLSLVEMRYNDILLTIPEVNNKVAYMAFSRGLMYGKLKKSLVLEKPLSQDQLIARVKQYVELEEPKNKETKGKDLQDVITRKRRRLKLPRKNPVWERIQRDRRQTSKRRQYDLQPQKGLVRCTQTTASAYSTPLRVLIAEVFSLIDYKNLLPKPSEIEKLIKCGYLKKFIDKGDQRDIPRQNRKSPQRDSRPRIMNDRKKHPLVTGRIDTTVREQSGRRRLP